MEESDRIPNMLQQDGFTLFEVKDLESATEEIRKIAHYLRTVGNSILKEAESYNSPTLTSSCVVLVDAEQRLELLANFIAQQLSHASAGNEAITPQTSTDPTPDGSTSSTPLD